MELSNVVFVHSEHSLAHLLMKVKLYSSLQEVLTTSNISHSIEQWVIREKTSDDWDVKKKKCRDVN